MLRLRLRLPHLASAMVVVAAAALVSCGDDGDSSPATSGATPTSPPASTSVVDTGIELQSSPQFLNRLIPGRRPLALVMATGPVGAVAFTATIDLDGASVEVLPEQAEPGTAVEIWVDLPAVSQDVPFVVDVEGRQGSTTDMLTLTATATPGTDDLAATAADIAAVFLDEFAGTVDALPATTDGLVHGTPVAGLLVVSHYAWFTDAAEIGLAWHIMVAPDDWAELYVRPRTALAPTAAYRLSSWSTALAGGPVTITPIDPPAEVTR